MAGTVDSGAPRREGSPYPKADLTLRGLARLADFTIAFGVATSAPGVGPLVAAAYLIVADGLMQGQSPGKKIFGVRAVVPDTRAPAGFQESILRNAPFAVVTLFWALPILWPAFFLVGLPVIGYETWQVLDEHLGRRLGDRLAETQVVDGKVVAGLPSAASGGQ
jgi:uncharacterized RDD family membrane protein YckC